MFQQVTYKQAPASHSSGSRPITGIFATAGICFLNIFQSSHGNGLGDHRYTVYDIDVESILGVRLQHVQRPATRRLRMEVDRNVQRFNRVMEQLVDEHRMFKKLAEVHDLSLIAPTSVVKKAFNKWDRQLEEIIKCSEKRGCGKTYTGSHDSSPIFKFWLKRVRLWRRALKHKQNPLPDPRNLYRDLKAQGFPKPSEIEDKLEECKGQAPQLRQDHLQARLVDAKEKGDDEAIKAITRIIKKERRNKLWVAARHVHGKKRGRSVLKVQVRANDGNVYTYDTQADVEAAAAAELNPRFRLSASAPIFTSPLLEYIGTMGEKPAVKEILAGTFRYPEGTDPFTKAIMKEACEVFQHMSPKDVVDLVEAQDFQEYWLHAREITSSSHSGMHFGIYMANARSDKLSLLHAAKLSLAAKLGITLDRWHNALTVLLEKSFGNIMIDKLRAICLLEADYTG
jgi:hypothetical protein